jgi:autophagy-related protein 17
MACALPIPGSCAQCADASQLQPQRPRPQPLSRRVTMSSSPAEGSHASISPPGSPSIPHRDLPLDTLVSHLLASKRSLSSIGLVYRANEIVTSARSALEESVKLSARTAFLRDGITEQAKVLRRVKSSIENVYKDGQKDFKSVLRTLDSANERLESTMDILRSTMVEAALRPAAEEPRSLLYFVDEQGVETMRDALKESIRESRVGSDHSRGSLCLIKHSGSTNLLRLLYSLVR